MKLKSVAYTLMVVAVVSCGSAQQCLAHPHGGGHKTAQTHRSRSQTLPAVTPAEARKRLDGDDGYVYLDVRTPKEFEAGRPKGAINIPVLLVDAETNRKTLNEAFLDVVEANFSKDAKLILGCRTGARSMMAQKVLHEAGFTDITTMTGGFTGQKDRKGKALHVGWSELGYPTEKGAAGPSGYDELRRQAEGDAGLGQDSANTYCSRGAGEHRQEASDSKKTPGQPLADLVRCAAVQLSGGCAGPTRSGYDQSYPCGSRSGRDQRLGADASQS